MGSSKSSYTLVYSRNKIDKMVIKTATNISNASSECVVVEVNPSNEEAAKQIVKPGESKKFYTNYGQIQVKLHLIQPDHYWYGSKSTRVEKYKGKYEENFCSHNNYIIKDGKTGLEIVQARHGTLWQ